MRKRCLFFMVLIGFETAVYAQSYSIESMLKSYRHTINYADHKLSFQVLENNRKIPAIAITKKYYWYGNNKLNVTEGGYSGKLLNGTFADFYVNGNLKEQGMFKLGLKNGKWLAWDSSGKSTSYSTFKNGVLDGVFRKYGNNGEILEVGKYSDGRLQGKMLKYSGPDSIVVTRYKNGVLVNEHQNIFKKFLRLFNKKKKTQ